MSRFAIETRVDDGRVVVGATGELDLSTAPALERALDGAVEDAGDAEDAVTLDLRGLRFIDSTGLRLVLVTDARLRDLGRPFHVIKGPEQVHRVFELALLEDRLSFVDGTEVGVAET